MPIITLIFGITCFAVCLAIAKSTKGPLLRSAYLHPISFLGLVTAMIGLDFFILGQSLLSGDIVTFSSFNLVSFSDYTASSLIFICISISSIFGYFIGLHAPIRTIFLDRYFSNQPKDNLPITFPLYLLGALAVAVILIPLIVSISSFGIFAVASMRQVFLSESLFYSFLTLCLIPAFFLYCSGSPNDKSIRIVSLSLVLFFLLIGTRGSIIMVLLGISVATLWNRKISALVISMASLLLVGAGYIYTYFSRFSYKYETLSDFYAGEGDPFTYIMKSPEMSIAESMMLHLNTRIIERGELDSILAAIIAFVPRSLVEWKPLGFSTEMTSAIDPERWALVQSEWTVSGYVNAVYEMGLAGGLLFNLILFYFLGAQFARSKLSSGLVIFTICSQFYLMLGYLRGDIHNLGIRAWAILVVLFIFSFVSAARRARL